MSYWRRSNEWFDGKPRGIVKFVPYNAKIADITHADTNKHTLDLAAALSETRKIIAIQWRVNRIAGTGDFWTYPNEGTDIQPYSWSGGIAVWTIIKDGTQRLQYKITVVNDDFDLYCFGYVVEV